MRPPGEVHQAIGRAAHALAAERAVVPRYSVSGEAVAGNTWRELSARACVGFSAGRTTVKNMARSGVLSAVGAMRVEGSRREMLLYAPTSLGLTRG